MFLAVHRNAQGICEMCVKCRKPKKCLNYHGQLTKDLRTDCRCRESKMLVT